MIVIRFGKWCSKATSMFTYDRVFRNGCEWTPICIKKFRYIDSQPTTDIDTITKAHADIAYKQGYRDGYAEAEPVRHGHWISINDDGTLWKCSVCGGMQCCYSNYCSDCGAKMDEVTE